MSTEPEQLDAIVLKCVPYRDSDTVVRLFTRELGACAALARRARSAKSSLGARLEPTHVVRVQVRKGRGELFSLGQLDMVEHFDTIRGDYGRQQAAARVLALLDGFPGTSEGDAAFNLGVRSLRALDTCERAPEAVFATELATSLKMLHVLGVAPELTCCISCGIVLGEEPCAFAPTEGGCLCGACAAVDAGSVDADTRALARLLIVQPLADAPTHGATESDLRRVDRMVVSPMLAAHAGERSRNLPPRVV